MADRLQLVGDIWDSIAEEANATPDILPADIRRLKSFLFRAARIGFVRSYPILDTEMLSLRGQRENQVGREPMANMTLSGNTYCIPDPRMINHVTPSGMDAWRHNELV